MLVSALALGDLKLDNRRRIHRTTVGRGLCTLTACPRALGLLQDGHLVGEGATVGGDAGGRVLGLIVDGDDVRTLLQAGVHGGESAHVASQRRAGMEREDRTGTAGAV